ncbi:hypothetical protein HQ520_10035, partial [bacterium]|nr:hypothetical protein [bacterium]
MSAPFRKILPPFLLTMLLPFCLNFFAYHGFVSGYTGLVFSEDSFRKQYE